jgi:hypothetical protein
MTAPSIPILFFADEVLGIQPYPWQCKILLNYEAGHPTAVAAANFTGKTSTVFPICALWTLANFPTARVMYLSATGSQVEKQFFAALNRFRGLPAFASWSWLSCEVRTNRGGFLFGRSTDTGGHIEGIHNQVGSPASLLIDECKTVDNEVIDTFSRCTTDFRLFMSSTGNASGGFYQIMTAQAHLWKTFTVTSSMCPHVDPALIAADRENLKDSVFAIKHDARFLYDAGDSMISLEHVRALIDKPPAIVHGKTSAFCDFAGAGDESVLALCQGNDTPIVDAWRHRDTLHSVGKFLNWFRILRLKGWDIGGDEGYGHQLMDRMAEQDFHLQRVNNGAQAKRNDIFVNLSAEWWSTVGQLIERRMIRISNDEKLIAQLTSRRKLYDSRGARAIGVQSGLGQPRCRISRSCGRPDWSCHDGPGFRSLHAESAGAPNVASDDGGADHPQRGGPVAGRADSILSAFRLPALRSLGDLADRAPVLVVDTREQEPLAFERLAWVRGTLTTGDYSVAGLQDLFSVERKTVSDLVGCCMGDNRERFERELHRLRGYRFKRLLLVGSEAEILASQYHSNIKPNAVLATLYAFEVRYDLPVVFVPTAQAGASLVERWAFYFTREAVGVTNDLWRAN